MHSLRFVLLGGFLGAGKTTAMARLARHYLQSGCKIGIVTNDQAQDLVDTHNLRQQGFAVAEVAGACFCCKFDDLVSQVGSLEASQRPDIILAEPVGSCTDLVATVVQPLKKLYAGRFQVAPYTVLFKPSHGLKILRHEVGGFSPKAAYIFRKQLEEADAILLNRIDELTADVVEELVDLVNQQYPGVPVLRISAKTGQGFEAVTALLEQQGDFGRKVLDIDYDVYAAGEAELGWLNSSARVTAAIPFALDELLLSLVQNLQTSLKGCGAEVAHLKVIGLWEGFFGVANLVSSDGRATLSQPSHCRTTEAELIVNARVALDPDVLREQASQVLTSICQSQGAQLRLQQTQSFRPARPQPTHRYAMP